MMTISSYARECPACKTPLPEEAQFCLRCGHATPPDPGVPPRTAVTGIVEVAKVKRALASRYKVERVLGEGGMATVYLAQDLKYNRSVAVKVMRPELASTLGADLFLREVEIAARLTHPHILPMYESGEAQGLLYYVMPYVEGETLRDRIKRETQLPVEDALKIAREVAEALACAHERGIIHRDIKPANILLSGGHAMVADFGIARALSTTSTETLTQTGLAVGTPHYMAPEQAMGDRDVDARADIYAVGALLYEMIAGEPPFTGPTPQAIVTRSMTEAPRSLTATRTGLVADVNQVAMKALAKSPADRYSTATALATALDQALDVTHSGARPVIAQSGPAPLHVLGLFLLASAAVLAMAYALVHQVGLPQWMFLLAGVLMVAGLPIAARCPGWSGPLRYPPFSHLAKRPGRRRPRFRRLGRPRGRPCSRSPTVAGATPQARGWPCFPSPTGVQRRTPTSPRESPMRSAGSWPGWERFSSSRGRVPTSIEGIAPSRHGRSAGSSGWITCSAPRSVGPRRPTEPAGSKWCLS